MNKKKIAFRIALVLALCIALVSTFASCRSNTAIDTSKGLDYWAGTSTEVETNAPEGSETAGADESDTATDGSEIEGAETEEPGSEAEDVEDATSEKKDVVVTTTPGFIDRLLSWVGIFLRWITSIMPANSYILTLFVFAIILEIVFIPLSIKQQKNSIRQAKLRPKEMAIRKKYAGRNDQVTQQKVTQEIQELYQKENYNPMSGCLPLLLQLPVVLVLYWVVIDPIKYIWGYSADFTNFMYAYLQNEGIKLGATNGSVELLNKISDLAHNSPEVFANIGKYCGNPEEVMHCINTMTDPAKALNFNIGPVNFGNIPSFDFSTVNAWLLLLPVLTFFVYFFSMKINRKFTFQPNQGANDRQTACSNNMMDFTMPLMSVWMTFIVPAAVGVYWMFKSILGVVKQFIMSKVMPLPKFTEEDYKAAEKEMLGKQHKKIQKSENAGKVRSLHHIDDEDYDEHGNYCPKAPEKEPEEVETKLPENKMTEGAALKDDSDKGEKKSFFGKKDKKD